MLLPLLWIICGFWFYSSARKVNARPWVWVGVMMGASLVFYLLLAVIWAFSSDAIQPHYSTPGRFTDAEFAAFKRYEFLDKVAWGGSFAADIGFVVGLRAFMMRKAPFQNPESAQSTPAHNPVYAPASKTTCDQCGGSVPSGFYLEKSHGSRYLCEKCRAALVV